MTCKNGWKAFYSQYRLTFQQMSSELMNTLCRSLDLEESIFHNNMEISTESHSFLNNSLPPKSIHLLSTQSIWLALNEQLCSFLIFILNNTYTKAKDWFFPLFISRNLNSAWNYDIIPNKDWTNLAHHLTQFYRQVPRIYKLIMLEWGITELQQRSLHYNTCGSQGLNYC